MKDPSRAQPSARSSASHPLLLAGLAGAALLLASQIREYAFLTDDAYIAFRYARNLARGAGLVFNPGHEAVEGYTSPLWTVLLGALDRLGVPPTTAANALSIAATFVLWALVLRFCARRPGASRAPWLVLLPAFGLAANRSFAVWATGGLETRWFETLAVAGLLRLVEEREREARLEPVRRFAPLLLGIACLTRPEGVLVAGCAALAVAIDRARRGRLGLPRLAAEWWPCLVAVAAPTAFRRLYYHEWLPNTWFTKVGGEFFWGSGARYLAAFTLEYALWLGVPLLGAAVAARREAGRGFLPLLAVLVLAPHLAYVASVGGDHFEYRPLGLELLLGLVLLHEGATAIAARPRARLALAAYAVLGILLSTVIPRASHRQFPSDYRTGFPGAQFESPEGEAFLDPARDPVLRLPGLSRFAAWHRDLTRELTGRLVAVRQEEHRLFLGTLLEEGRELRTLVEQGVLPPDVHVAIDCVGAIPYESGLRTLDRLGLTDRRVAKSPRAGVLMGHWRFASMEYASEAGVDLWADDRVHLICALDSRLMLRAYNARGDGVPRYAADLGEGRFLLAQLPEGPEAAARRMPGLRFESFDDTAFVSRYLHRLAAAWRDSLSARPNNPLLASRLARLQAGLGDFPGAIRLLEGIIADGFGVVAVWETLAEYQAAAGQFDRARLSLRHAYAEARRSGDRDFLERWQRQAVLASPARPPAGPPRAIEP